MLKLAGNTHAWPNLPLEIVLQELSKLGFKAVDIWATPNMGEHLMPGKADVNAVKVMLKDFGIKPVAVSGFIPDRDLLKQCMEMAAEIGAGTYVRNIPATDDWQEYVEFILGTAKSFGLELAIENHKFGPVESEQELKDLLRLFPDPDLGIAFAPTHYYTCGFDPEDGIRICGDRLKYMYLWDVKKNIVQGSKAPHHKDPRAQVPGGGKLNWVSIAQTLDEIGYEGWSGIFWHGSQDWPMDQTSALWRQGIEYIHSAWDRAGVSR